MLFFFTLKHYKYVAPRVNQSLRVQILTFPKLNIAIKGHQNFQLIKNTTTKCNKIENIVTK